MSTWIEDEPNARIAREAVRVYLAGFLADGWVKVVTPCKPGQARTSTTIRNAETGKTITCTIIPRCDRRRTLRKELDLSE